MQVSTKYRCLLLNKLLLEYNLLLLIIPLKMMIGQFAITVHIINKMLTYTVLLYVSVSGTKCFLTKKFLIDFGS